MFDGGGWPAWGTRAAWTLATLAIGWGCGSVLGVVLAAEARRWLREPHRTRLAAAIGLVRRQLPLWFLLVGAWLSASYWPLSAEGGLLVDRVVFAVGALSVTWAAAAIATHAVDTYAAAVLPALPASSLTRNIVWGGVAVLGLLVVLNGLGLSITPMLTALGVGGLAVALALQEPLANFFAGVFVTLAGQIRVGDYVKLDSGEEGYVADFSWRSTRLRMLANNLVIVPNAKLAQAIVINHWLPSRELAVLVEVGVDYRSDLPRVEEIVTEVGRSVMTEVAGGVPDFLPFIRYHSFGESSVDFTVILRAREFVDQYLVKHEFIKRLHARFDREGIVIPFPIRTVEQRPPADPSAQRQDTGLR